jgi:hypothetical protein
MKHEFASKSIQIVLADGVERDLRFDLGAVRRIKMRCAKDYPASEGAPKDQALQSAVMRGITLEPEIIIPHMLMEGLQNKTGIASEDSLASQLTGDMLDELTLVVIEGFFGQRLAGALRDNARVQDAARHKAVSVAMEKLTEKEKSEPAPATDTRIQ